MRTLSHIPLSDIVYYHIGGEAREIREVSNRTELLETLTSVVHEHIAPVHIIGLGANLLIPDVGFSGVVILLQSGTEDFTVTESAQVTAFAGGILDSLIKFSLASTLVGLGWAGGLPSSIGGAIRGNAGAFGHEIEEYIASVDVVDMNDPMLQVQTFSHADCKFGYRDSVFKRNKNLVIVSAVFQLENATSEQLQKDEKIYHDNIAYRNSHHPMEYPSCGSVFKNIIEKERVKKVISVWPNIQEKVEKSWYGKVSMAYVIGRLGFSGYQVGNAQVSAKHNNYISNLGNAKAEDVKAIIKEIEKKFVEVFGFIPELEVEIVA